MENEKKLKLEPSENTSLNVKVNPKLVPKPTPKPIAEKVREALLVLREKALNTINNVLDYTLINFTEMYNSATNGNNFNINNSNNGQQKVALNEQAVTQELIAKAKYEGDSKEVVLNNKGPNNQTMVGSSLVVDMDAQKIEATIQEMDKRLNPVQKIETPEPEIEENKGEQEKTPEIKPEVKAKKKSENKKSLKVGQDYPIPKPKLKLKPEAPKPAPKKKKELKVEETKSVMPTINVQANVDAMRAKFLRNQEDNPHVLEEQNFQTVLKPQEPIFVMKNKDAVIGSISNITKNLRPQEVPDAVIDPNGLEQVKLKSRLK